MCVFRSMCTLAISNVHGTNAYTFIRLIVSFPFNARGNKRQSLNRETLMNEMLQLYLNTYTLLEENACCIQEQLLIDVYLCVYICIYILYIYIKNVHIYIYNICILARQNDTDKRRFLYRVNQRVEMMFISIA